MRTLHLATALALAASALIGGCSDDDNDDDNEETPRADAGPDSGTRTDAGTDAGRDSGMDASVNLDAGGSADASTTTRSDGGWTVYPYDAGTNPAANVRGIATATRNGDAGITVTLDLSGLEPNREFGSHVHKLACTDMQAGGHYQNVPFPDGGSANDPTYANNDNEVWLDFTTTDAGVGQVTRTVGFVPRPGQAKSVVVHSDKTHDGGVAGSKLSCTDLPF